jgi:transcription elongation factor B subunit 1
MEWVRLQSVDGFSYLVRKNIAQASGTIRNMLDPSAGYAEAISRICEIKERYVFFSPFVLVHKEIYVFSHFRGIIVEKLVEYMCFKSQYEHVGPKEDIPLKEFLERIPPEIVLELCVHTFTFFAEVRITVKFSFVFRLLAADYQESGYLIILPCFRSHLGFCSVIQNTVYRKKYRRPETCHDGHIVEITKLSL